MIFSMLAITSGVFSLLFPSENGTIVREHPPPHGACPQTDTCSRSVKILQRPLTTHLAKSVKCPFELETGVIQPRY
jgi:hypothetical protein